MPSFDRELVDAKNGRQVLNNVVIRPEHHLVMEQCIPNRYDILFIGDITLIGSVNQQIHCITSRYYNDLDWFFKKRPKIVRIDMGEQLHISGDVL